MTCQSMSERSGSEMQKAMQEGTILKYNKIREYVNEISGFCVRLKFEKV